MPTKTYAALCGALFATVAMTAPAAAEDWIVSVGGQINAAPPYEGAGYDLFLPLPALGLRRASQPGHPTIAGDAPGIAVLSKSWISFGPNVRFRGSRDDTGLRQGLDKIGIAAEPGLFLTLWPTNWLRLHGEERRGVIGYHGWVGDAGLDLVAKMGPWTATAGPRIGWGDTTYMQTYFGVSPAEAAASPVIDTPYAPRGGRRYLGAGAGLSYRFNPSWQVNANAGFHRLDDVAANSPIVRLIGSRNDYSGGVGFKYSFHWSH